MPFGVFFRTIKETFHGTWNIIKQSLTTLRRDPHILIYPYLAILFILLTSPVVGRIVFGLWQKVEQPEVINQVADAAPNELLVHLGLVTFSVFYTIFVTSFFTCMASASVLAKLEDKPTSLLYGLNVVLHRLGRVALFSLLAIFFFPMGLAAQRQKFRSFKGAWEAISSSFSLSMTQLAPAIITTRKGVFDTVCHTVERLGHLWKESFLIRVSMFLTILLLGSISFLPKVIEHYWFQDSSSQVVSWIATALLGASSYVLIRVIGAVFTTTLYFEAKNKK